MKLIIFFLLVSLSIFNLTGDFIMTHPTPVDESTIDTSGHSDTEPSTEIDVGVTEEQREASKEIYENMMKQQFLMQYGRIFETMNGLFLHDEEQGKIHNLIRGADEAWRCIVHNGKEIKEAKLEEGASISYQIFEPENGDEIMWVYYHPEHRMIIRQTGYDIDNDFTLLNGDDIGRIYQGNNLGYFAGFLSDMACLNNVLLDPDTLERFEVAQSIADQLIGDTNDRVKTFITNNLTIAKDLTNLTTDWKDAKELDDLDFMEYGISVVANDVEIIDYSNTIIFYWVTPPMFDESGEPVKPEGFEENVTVLRTGMLREDNLPPPEANSISDFKVRLKMDENWKAVLLLTQSGIGEKGFINIELFKRDNFNPLISKNI